LKSSNDGNGAERLDGDTVFDPTTDGVPNAEPAVTLDAETLLLV